MKKLMSLMIGLSLALGTVAMFAEDAPVKKEEKKASKKKVSKKKTAEPKKEGTK